MKIFQKNPESNRNNYLLEVVDDVRATRSMKKSRIKGGFSHVKRILAVAAMVLVVGSSAATGLATINNSTNEPQANADWGFLGLEKLGCVTKDQDNAYLGGMNSVIEKGLSGNTSKGTLGNLLDAKGPHDANDSATERWTALEQYGYFAPSYTSWQGMYIDEEDYDDDGIKAPFIGTGGGGEQNGVGSLVWVTDADTSPLFSDDMVECFGFGPEINVAIANSISAIPKFLVAATGELYGWANGVTLTNVDSPLYSLGQGIKDLIVGVNGEDGLAELLFFDFLTPVILVATMGLIWTGLVKRSSLQAAQGALWMIGATIGAILFLTAPLKVAEVIDSVVGTVNGNISDALVSEGTGGDLCALKDSGTDRASRQVKCIIWYSTIYTPWVSGQFNVNQAEISKDASMSADPNIADGQSTAGSRSDELKGEGYDDIKDDIADTKDSRGVFSRFNAPLGTGNASASAKNWPYYQMHVQAAQREGVGTNYSEIAYNQLVINGNDDWKGASNAVGASFMSLLAAAGPSLVILSMSFTLIAYQVTMLVLIAFSPLFFLIGVAPGWGRRIAMRWLEMVVGLLVKRIILMMFLLVYIKFYTLIVALPGLNFFFQLVLVIVLSAIAMTQRSKILSLFTDVINFGGTKSLGDDGSVGNTVTGLARGTLKGTNNFARTKGVAAVGTGARAIKGTSSMTSSAVKDKIDRVGAVKKDAKLGITTDPKTGKPNHNVNDLAAHGNAKGIKDIDTSRLSAKEKALMTDDKGNIDTARGDAWVNNTKTKQVQQSAAIDDDYKKNLEERKKVKKIQNPVARRNKVNELRQERETIRKKQATLNKDVRRVFGEAGNANDKNTNTYTSSKDNKDRKAPLNTEYKKKRVGPTNRQGRYSEE